MGTAVAILVDATVIRAILVPAVMRLGCRADWWPAAAPRPAPRSSTVDLPDGQPA